MTVVPTPPLAPATAIIRAPRSVLRADDSGFSVIAARRVCAHSSTDPRRWLRSSSPNGNSSTPRAPASKAAR